MPKIDELAATVQELAAPGARAKEIIAAVRDRHPGASKKDVVQAAFFALTGGLDADPARAKRLHDLAMSERGPSTGAAPAEPRPKKGKPKRQA